MLGSHYHLAIKGINTKDAAIEGMETAITFTTPSCWEMHDFSTSLCSKFGRKSMSNGNYRLNPNQNACKYIVFSSATPSKFDINSLVGEQRRVQYQRNMGTNATGVSANLLRRIDIAASFWYAYARR